MPTIGVPVVMDAGLGANKCAALWQLISKKKVKLAVAEIILIESKLVTIYFII